MLAGPFSGAGDDADDKTGNPTPLLLVLGPVQIEGEPKGLVEIFQRPSSDVRTQRGYLKFLLQMCELMGDFLRSRQLRQFSDRQTLWNQLENFNLRLRIPASSLRWRLSRSSTKCAV